MLRRKMIIIGALVAVALLTGVSQAVPGSWVGAEPNATTEWFKAGNWDVGTIMPEAPAGLGYTYYITGVYNVDVNNVPGKTAAAMLLEMSQSATSIVRLKVDAGATLKVGDGGGTSGIESGYSDGPSGASQDFITIYGTIESISLMRIARLGDSTVTVKNGGSLLLVNGTTGQEFRVHAGNGTLKVDDGGYVKAGYINLGMGNTGMNASNGRSGTTTATVDCNGIIDLTGSLGIHVGGENINGGSMAVVNLRSGELRNSGNMNMPNSLTCKKSIVNVSGGRLTVAGTVGAIAGTLNPSLDRQFNITGGQVAIRNWNHAAGNLTQAGGTFSPAIYDTATSSYNEVGRTDFGTTGTVSYTQAGGTIQIDLAGSTPSTGTIVAGRHDVIASTGTITLGGQLKVVFREGYSAYANDTTSYTVITATGGISGGFSNLTGGRVNAYNSLGGFEGTYLVTNTGTSIVLSNYSATNLPPVIAAMSNINTYLAVANSIAIAPTVTDPDGDIATVTYAWSITSQPLGSNVTILPGTTSKDITVGVDMVGTYVLRLTATDGGGKIGVNSVTINVAADACAAAKLSPTYTRIVGDVDNNCKVNFLDVAQMTGNWLHCNNVNCL